MPEEPCFAIELSASIHECEAWQSCLAAYLRSVYYRSESHSTLRNYRLMLRDFFTRVNKAPDACTRADVEAFLYAPSTSPANRGQPVVATTRNMRLSVLSSFYKYASVFYADGADQPLMRGPGPTLGLRYSLPARHYRAFSYEEMEKFFDVIPTNTVIGLRDRALFLVYFWTARRRSEILRLCWGDLSQGLIVDGNERRVGWMYHFRGKGRQNIDDVAELPQEAKEIIDLYLERSGRLATIGARDPIFIGHGPGWRSRRPSPLNGNFVNSQLKRYAVAAGLDARRLSLHSLRHSAAQARYSAGADIRSIQHLLRHESLATTDMYLNILVGTSDPTAKLLSARFGHFSNAAK